MAKVTIKNEAVDLYVGSDDELKLDVFKVKAGGTVEVSLGKAKQLLRDFPKNWSFVSTQENSKAIEEELNAIQQTALSKGGKPALTPAAKAQQIIKEVPGPSILEEFIAAVKDGKYTSIKVVADTISLLEIIPFVSFVSSKLYKNDVKLLEGEIGCNIKKNIRYILVDKNDKVIDIYKLEEKKEKKEDKKEDKKEEDKEGEPLVIKQSRELDPEEDLGVSSVLDQLEGEDDDEKSPRKKRTARRMRPKDEDDED